MDVLLSSFSTTFMSHAPRPRRGTPQPGPQDYAAVPQSPRSAINHPSSSQHVQNPQYVQQPPTRTPSANSNQHHSMQAGRGAIAMGVASGTIGAGYGPYSVRILYRFHSLEHTEHLRSTTQTAPEMLVFITPRDLVLYIQNNL